MFTQSRYEKIESNIENNLDYLDIYIDSTKKRYISLGKRNTVNAVGDLTLTAISNLTAAVVTLGIYPMYLMSKNNGTVDTTILEKYRKSKVESRIEAAKDALAMLEDSKKKDPKYFLYFLLTGEGNSDCQSFKCGLCQNLTKINAENDEEAEKLVTDCLMILSKYIDVNVKHFDQSLTFESRIYNNL